MNRYIERAAARAGTSDSGSTQKHYTLLYRKNG